jgi:hypothetical protein
LVIGHFSDRINYSRCSLSYGELAGMINAGGQFLHSARLRQISFILMAGPFYGNSNGIAAIAVTFANYAAIFFLF